MNRIYGLIFIFLLSGCITSPKETATKLQNIDQNQVLTPEKAVTANASMTLKFNERTSGELTDKDPIVVIDKSANERSYSKVVVFTSQSAEQVIEIHTQAHKGWGFGSVSMIYPYVEFFDSDGKDLRKNVSNLFFGNASTFMDGQYLRAVYKLINLKPNSQYRVLVAAKTSLTGKSMGSVTNYGAAGAGIFMQNGVQASPVGPFWILQTDTFKR